jgi:Flp pilus assembly protein TadG
MNTWTAVRSWCDEKGQDLVELALLLPLLMILTLGVLDLGRALGTYVALKNASREGARYVSLYSSQATVSSIQDRVIAEASASGFGGLARSDVVVEPSSDWYDGRPVRVRINYDFQLITALIVGDRTVPLQASTEMVVIGGP